jgi:hypothetical protein
MIRLLIIIATFFYFYTPELVFLPVSLRVVLGCMGIALFITEETSKFLKYNSDKMINIGLVKTSLSFLAIILSSFVFGLINGVFDGAFVNGLFVKIVMLFGASYLIFKLLKWSRIEISPITPLNLIVTVTTIQCLVSVMMFASPTIKLFFDSIVKASDNPTMLSLLSKNVTSYRILGFGTSFFGAGLEVTFCLLTIVALIRGGGPISKYTFWWYMIAFIVNTSVGILMARTTFIGLGISLAFLFYPFHKSESAKQFSKVMLLILVGMAVFVLLNLSNPNYGALMFAFEALINLQSGNGLTTDSSEDLKTMYLWPNEFRTYLLGNGLMNDPVSPGQYYMGTDVGYLRLIYFGGIPFAILWFWVQLNLLLNTVKNMPNISSIYLPLSFAVTFFLLVANGKGLSDYFPHLIFIYCASFFVLTTNENREVVNA